MTTCAWRCLDGLERGHEQSLDPFQRIGSVVDDLLVAREEPVEEVAQDLFDHLLLGLEVVVEAAGEDSRRVGDVAHGGGPQSALGEHRRGELEKLVAARAGRAAGCCGHGRWLDTEITSPVR